ncbi:uncharacterized protein Z520_08927 [Fonsecaea multimorphosa CBS 102226]|uniref:Impact N-terminal domain-containing protein n=1 Tax=Fonsecaea multimorphosa CBS 102226 TaxID=1442371 RepID=A0A0D2H0V4_9EURO|nr:uncharacterized protein Z520_08927 [Fonsecaea multimorphosa CBS 102226]KIX95410.1 hypothetical protein Z520_08927 [Fonsecaea multimorphosa CBS 102226]OAL20941.1 hypothetical protein AYO22_08361 [Fonsecaea multimorphosa]
MSTPTPSKQTPPPPTTTKRRGKRAASPEEDTTTPVRTDEAATTTRKGNLNANEGIFISSPIHDRQSTFVAHFHPAASGVFEVTKQQSGGSGSKRELSLTATVKRLQAHPSFTTASHRIVAWRRRSSQQTLFSASAPGSSAGALYATGSEDDGEKYAGKRLERLLGDLDVEGVVVVARWYGGVLLGPVRFTHIESVAREAVRKWRESVGGGGGAGVGSKRRRLLDSDPDNDAAGVGVGEGDGHDDDEAALKSRLADQLAERDRSIVVLRGLLADKTKPASSTTEEKTPSSPGLAKKIEYSEMPLVKLKQLEKARDATIAFILRQLDKLEEEEKSK